MRVSRIVCYGLVVCVVACGSDSTSPASQTGSTGVSGSTIYIAEYSVSPSTVAIKAGTTVQWTNTGQLTHNVTADDGSWSSGNLSGQTSSGAYGSSAGASFSRVFSQVGTYTFHCSLHPPGAYPGFVGTVIVTQ